MIGSIVDTFKSIIAVHIIPPCFTMVVFFYLINNYYFKEIINHLAPWVFGIAYALGLTADAVGFCGQWYEIYYFRFLDPISPNFLFNFEKHISIKIITLNTNIYTT
jgi:hypothetical protein